MLLCSSSPTTSLPPLDHLTSSYPRNKSLNTHSALSLLPKCKDTQSLRQIHAQTIKNGLHRTHFAMNKLLEFSALSPSGDLSYALQIFHSIEQPDHFAWNTIIRGYTLSPSPILAVHFYIKMLLSGFHPNSYTFPFLLKSCALCPATQEGKQIHTQVLKLGLGFGSDPFVHTSLINMYARNGELSDARQVFDTSSLRDVVSFTALINGYFLWGQLEDAHKLFDEIHIRDVVSWNAMISGYAQSGQFEKALELFREMLRAEVEPDGSTMVSVLSACAQSGSIEMGKWVDSWINDRGFGSNLRLKNALIDMYSKCGELDMARVLFNRMHRRDQVSWNVMIGGYTHLNHYKQALALFRQMQQSNEQPNEVTFLSVLPACARLGALDIGKWIHTYINKNMCGSASSSLHTSLIDMYSKCGSIESARQVFNAMKTKSLSSWNAIISGLAMHGLADEAFECFTLMTGEGLQPDDITFVGILSACSQAGLVEIGNWYFDSMIRDHKILPKVHHYGCMIDLLGRAGLFEEAKALIKKMEVKPDGAIWGSLLGACRVHGNVELAEYAVGNLLELEADNPGIYVLLSNIYAGDGRWEDVARIRTSLNDKGMKKVPGCSSIEVDSVVHEFLVGDKTHPRSAEIFRMLDEIDSKLELAGHVPDTSEVLYDIEEDWKEGALSYHSEKLAIAFGLISTNPGTRIRIVKNLRVCGNCHSATKLISKIYNREIIARDRNRFHHFKDGVCSCNDYW